jgi:hypothetical protein
MSASFDGRSSPRTRKSLAARHFELRGSRRVVEIRNHHARNPAAHGTLDCIEAALLVGSDEREGITRGIGTTRAADAVNVVFRGTRHIEVDNVAECLDVDATRGNVGRDQHRIASTLESIERRRPLRLRAVAVNALRINPVAHQVLGNSVGAMLRACEDECLPDVASSQQVDEQRRLQMLRHRVRRLRDRGSWRCLALQADGFRVLQHVARKQRNRRWHRGAEEQRLPPRREVLKHAADRRQKPHVQHAIGLVQYEVLESAE